jgi:antitoxin VapB
MAMNIKNEETHRLAKQLAQLTGTSVTEAVTMAVRESLRKYNDPEKKLARLQAIAEDCASRLSPEAKAMDIDEYLYDEMGFPK